MHGRFPFTARIEVIVKRTVLLAAVSLLLAGAAFANHIPIFSTNHVALRTGETVSVSFYAAFSGLDPTDYPVHWEFSSADENVAIVTGGLQSPAYQGFVTITGVGPGVTYVQLGTNPWQWVHIEVTCGREVPVTAAIPVITSLQGQPVSLQAIAYSPLTVFLWYSGRIGDLSHPIINGGAGPELRWTSATVGTTYVWVDARVPCSDSYAEFRIDIAPIRRRGAGH